MSMSGNASHKVGHSKVLDLGCGPNKVVGAYGVDKVIDLNAPLWDLEGGQFDLIICRHIIEHMDNVMLFMKEIHRIAKPNAEVRIETPHFSSMNSWSDPTHKGHFSSLWYEPFLKGNYLADQSGSFRLLSSKVTFGKSLRNRIGKLVVFLFSFRRWEKSYAFSYPGMDIQTRLFVEKDVPA